MGKYDVVGVRGVREVGCVRCFAVLDYRERLVFFFFFTPDDDELCSTTTTGSIFCLFFHEPDRNGADWCSHVSCVAISGALSRRHLLISRRKVEALHIV